MTLKLENVSFEVGNRTHIYPMDLTLERGSLNVLLGATLAGKTTLMRIMAGLEKPTQGRLWWDGVDVTHNKVQQRDVAMVYQQFVNYPTLSVYDNIASPLKLRGIHRSEINNKVGEVAELLKLTPYLKRKPLELSGGQQQRCALARSLVKDAGLVLLDEPLANLDYKLREELREEFPRIFEKSGSIFVYATTEPEEALLLGGNTATMWQGRVTQFGLAAKVYRQPNNLTTATVYSNPPMNFLNVEKRGNQYRIQQDKVDLSGVLSDLADGDYRVGFRAHDIKLSECRDFLSFDTQVSDSEISGSETFLHFHYEGLLWVGLFRGIKNVIKGSALKIYINPNAFFVFNQNGDLIKAARSEREGDK